MITDNTAFKYEMIYTGLFEITQCWANDTVSLQCGAVNIWYKIRLIIPYTSDKKNVEDIKY